MEVLWRLANVILVSVALLLLGQSYAARWSRLPSADRNIGMGFILLLLTAAIGSAEQILRETPIGVRTGFTTLALIYLIVGLVRANRRNRAI